MEEARPDSLLGRVLSGYRLVERVGRGSFARVYRATHTVLEGQVAIKILHANMAESAHQRERFRREAIATARISHPNVIEARDFGETEDGLAYLIIEWVEGRTLASEIKAHAPFPRERVAHLARQLASGLAAAHALGLLHRDLKPANVMLVEEGGVERVKILDFGLVRALAKDDQMVQLTRAGQILGTPRYISPEAVRGAETTVASDLYSLGAMLFEMIAGATPFIAKSIEDLLRKHLEAPVPDPPPAGGLEALAKSLLDKDPARRPASAEAVIAAIDRLELEPWSVPEGRTLVAPPPIATAIELMTEPPLEGSSAGSITEPGAPQSITAPYPTVQKAAQSTLPDSSLTPIITADARHSAPRAPARDRPRLRWPWIAVLGVALLSAAWAVSRTSFTPMPSTPPPSPSAPSPTARARPAPPSPPPPPDPAQLEPAPEPMVPRADPSERAAPRPAKVKKPAAQAHAAPVAGSAPAAASLEIQLEQALEARGLLSRELSEIESTAALSLRLEHARRNGDAAAINAALLELIAAVRSTAPDAALLRKRLKRINALLQGLSGSERVTEFESRYFDLLEELTRGRDRSLLELARKTSALEREIRGAITP